MLIPLRHENMSTRRWPVITLSLIAINCIVFLLTHFTMEDQGKQLSEVKLHVLMLAAAHPELRVPEVAEDFVATFRTRNQRLWNSIAQPGRPAYDAWETRIRTIREPLELQSEMDSLGSQWGQISASSVTEQYAFFPAHPKAVSYLTANFLHGGWLHLIGNMWFLWLAGFVLEDNWGRVLYTVVYFVAGAIALQFHAWLNPGSLVPLVGASGAVAALMGAFLVRFPKMKIEMRWILGIRSLLQGGYSFSAAAYWLLPVWLLLEVFSGSLFGQGDGVAHWAHVGGFLFGAVAALVLKVSGLEQKASQAIEKKTQWTSAPEISRATELLEQGHVEQAAATLKGFLAATPDSVDACNLLQQIYWRQGDVPAYLETTSKLCALHLKAREAEPAWQNYDDFLNAGGTKLPAPVWFDLCRAGETLRVFERAMQEYEKLAVAYPADRLGLQAQIAAARICLKNLNRPQESLRFYEAAQVSPVPHLDWEMTIEAGIREAKKALSPVATLR